MTPQSQSAPFGETRRQNAPFREAASSECAFPLRRGAREVWGNPPPGCGALWRMPQLGKCARATPRQAAGRVARGPADLGLESGLTERRTLQPPSHGKAHSGGVTLTEKYTLYAGPHGKAQCAWLPAHRVRFLVRRADRMRFSVECAFPHLRKRGATSRKDAFCNPHLTERRTLGVSPSRKGAPRAGDAVAT